MKIKSWLGHVAKARETMRDVRVALDATAALGVEAGELAGRVHGEVRETLAAGAALGRVVGGMARPVIATAQEVASKVRRSPAPEPPLRVQVRVEKSSA